ncbi:Adenylate cyclase [Minicystis rosea]|nr:Adenylate cyclase [Minicystis rosea]
MLAALQPYHCLAEAQLADVLLAEARIDEALEHASSAAARLETLGTIDEGESLVRVVYAEALRENGDDVGFRAALATAHARLLTRAARFHQDAERRRFPENIPENARTLALVSRWSSSAA